MRYILLIFCLLFISLFVNSQSNLYDLSGWVIGAGSTLDFDRYGPNISNVRELGLNHLEQEVVLWNAIPNSSNADGGLYGTYKTIDNTKSYRLSVWIKKTNSNDGSTYFGCRSYSSSTYQTLNLDGSLNTNPYFWYGDLPKLNHWYLITGFVHSSNYSGPTLGRIYDGETGEIIGNTYRDFKFSSNATNLLLRAFLYGDNNLQDRQFLFEPRMEVIDGSESTLEELLHVNPDSKLLFSYDSSGNQNQRFYCPSQNCLVPTPSIRQNQIIVLDNNGDFKKNIEIDMSSIELNIYPNPTSDKVTLEIKKDSDISIEGGILLYDATGSMIMNISSITDSKTQIDLDNQSSGIYFLHLHLSNGDVITERIIKN